MVTVQPEKMTLLQFYKDPAFNHHSRIPVYADSPEYITGYILRSEALEMLAGDQFKVRLGDIKQVLVVPTQWQVRLQPPQPFLKFLSHRASFLAMMKVSISL